MNKKSLYIIISLLLLSLSVTFVDAVIKPNYFLKIPIKIIFFIVIPMSYFIINRKEFKEFKKLFTFKRKGILKSLLFGLVVYFIIVGGYFLTRNILDFSLVASNLTNSMGITADNFIYVSLYISLMNSFLEEFFFRGYGFITLKKHTNKVFSYLYSPILFTVYHMGMMIGSFHIPTFILILICLFISGCIFNYLNEKHDNIYPSWFVHMFANFGINTVGFILFGVL